jgi:membrane protein
MSPLKKILSLLKTAEQGWNEDNVVLMTGALAYSTVFSITPLLIIATAVAGFVFP